jgi:UDP-2-acetamido-3-amino-2,3-dideoxy-glucuronate N-acetyltransferase
LPDLNEIYKDCSEQQKEALALAIAGEMSNKPYPSVAQCYIDRTAVVGARTKVWWYARVLQQVILGDDVSIGGGTEIGRGSYIGSRSRIGANCFLPPNTKIGERVFIGPNVTMCDDKRPKVPGPMDPPYVASPPVIGNDAVIGASVTILPGVIIGEYAFIGAGALVTKDVPAHAIWIGVPAKAA